MKNRSQRYDINRPRPRHGDKYTKYIMCLNIMVVICIKKYLSNIWNYINILQIWKTHFLCVVSQWVVEISFLTCYTKVLEFLILFAFNYNFLNTSFNAKTVE